jgi:hypothetical protein
MSSEITALPPGYHMQTPYPVECCNSEPSIAPRDDISQADPNYFPDSPSYANLEWLDCLLSKTAANRHLLTLVSG